MCPNDEKIGSPGGQKITRENYFSVFKLDKKDINIDFCQLKTARAHHNKIWFQTE